MAVTAVAGGVTSVQETEKEIKDYLEQRSVMPQMLCIYVK